MKNCAYKTRYFQHPSLFCEMKAINTEYIRLPIHVSQCQWLQISRLLLSQTLQLLPKLQWPTAFNNSQLNVQAVSYCNHHVW